ncbi:lysylphosphatidylglycerol synthase domain-containing protein [Streptomyces sp. NPDC005474]|uniref:lysylphosphatidylglycerol synthase domain-containing protein n=1 Tax=Streptomyces sp. NPDC005474 TaxID=3154878 RepID=UPI003456F97E
MSVVEAPAKGSRRMYWHASVALVVMVLGCAVLAAHRRAVDTGTDRLATADRGWLLVAAAAALSTWMCAAVVQQGAVAERLPAGRLVAAQFAASAANHLLPAGVGASAVNLRFLTRCGLSTARSATALAVKAAAGGIVRVGLAVALLLTSPRAPHLSFPVLRVPFVLAAVCGVVAVVAGVAFSKPLRSRLLVALDRVRTDVRAVHGSRARACALWGGSLAFALLHAAVVIAVVRALDVSLPAGQVLLAYLVASGAAALLPTPGGLGSLDAALAFALTAAGAPGSVAVSAVFGYRLLTGWLPLVPGLLVLGFLARRSVL